MKLILLPIKRSFVWCFSLIFLLSIQDSKAVDCSGKTSWYYNASWNVHYSVGMQMEHSGRLYQLTTHASYGLYSPTSGTGAVYWTDLGACASASAPTISTTAISSTTCSSASSGGNSISDGGASITAKGVCWSTSSSPTTSDSKTSDGSGTGDFASSITGLTAGVTYYVRAYATNSEGTSYGSQVSFTATALPTISGSNGNSGCGTGTMTIDATASAGSIEWYAASSGGSSLGGSSSGASWTTPSISSTTTYYAEATNGSCLSAARTAVTATVNAIPTISGSNGNSRCGTGTTTIDATASAGTIEWYAASSGGSSLGGSSSGASWTTPSISSTTTYYAEATNGSCLSASRTAVTATVNAVPTVTGSTDGSRCNNGTVDIQATVSAGSVEWFTASSGGSSIGSSSSGVNWTTPSITATTTYYAEALSGSCTSASRTAVTATKNVASDGPAGLTDELHVWLKADAGTGSIGTSWEDQSCNGFDYTTVAGPTVETDGWNYNKVIEIASGGFDAPSGAELGTDWTIFFVSALLSSDNNGRLVDGHSGDYLFGYQGGYRNGID